jgi:hypothetical protein
MGPGASKAREYSLARQGFVRVELVRIAPRDEVLAGRYQGVVGGIATSTTPCHARGRRRGACRCLLPSPSWHPSRCLLPSRPLPGPGVLPSPSWHPDALRTMTRPHEANTINTRGRRRGRCQPTGAMVGGRRGASWRPTGAPTVRYPLAFRRPLREPLLPRARDTRESAP